MLIYQQEDDMPKRYLKPDQLSRLEDIKDEIKGLVREATRIVRPTAEYPSAHAYWIGHILSALDDEEYDSGSATTMQETIDALDPLTLED